MGNYMPDVVEGFPSAQEFKVHGRMCSVLLKSAISVSKIFPELEGARPRCTAGIDALCLINNGIVKSKSLLQHCSESSALYLALTGEAILSRCKKSRNLMEQNLSQIQNMIPTMLAAKVSGIVAELRNAVFCLDSSEEAAGRVLKELLRSYNSSIDSTEEAALTAIHNASSLLRISTQKALLIEKRSIRKQLDRVGDERVKKEILLFLLNLLKKYGKSMPTEHKFNGLSEHSHSHSIPPASPYRLSGEVDLRVDYRSNEVEIDMLSRPVAPEEFICPLSSRLMHDPVVIASGQTYERMWIQRWFDEGNNTCPKTNRTLANLSFTSNIGMKDLIRKWCATYNVSIPDPKLQETFSNSWETSSNSIVSLTSSLYNLNLPLDFSNVSLGSTRVSDLDISNNAISSHETDEEFISKFSDLPWDSQCNAVQDVKKLLKLNTESCSEKFVQLILTFLQDAHNFHDVEAQMTGCLLLLEVVQKHISSVLSIKEDLYNFLASLLDTEVAKQALSILEELSFHKQTGNKIVVSGAVVGILNIVDSQIPELLEPALKILSNLSSNCGFIVPSTFIPKLNILIEDNSLSRYCITILKNMCDDENGRASIAGSSNCIASIAKLLETGNDEEQELGVCIFLTLCCQRREYCQLVMDEGIIPSLVNTSLNGNNKAKAMSMELLRILRDEMDSNNEESSRMEDVVDLRRDKSPPKASSRGLGKFLKGLGVKKKSRMF